MIKNIRILYMGTPDLSAEILQGLIDNGYNIIGVVAQKDKPIGRKNVIEPVPTKKVALKHNINVYQPNRIRDDYDFVRELKPDLIITCAYGQIVPQGLLDIPLYGSINVHGSLLPKYRGASPIQQALINRDIETGVTIMEMINKMDAGAMIYKKSFPILKEDNYTSLCKKMAQCGLEALIESLPDIINKTIEYIPQDESEATFCSKIKKEEEHLNIYDTAENVLGWIKALSDNIGGYVLLDNQIFKIFDAEVIDINGKPGEIVKADSKGLYLALGEKGLSLLVVQKQGKKKMDYRSFINGDKTLLGKFVR